MPEDMYGFTVAEREEFLRLAAKMRKLDQGGLIPISPEEIRPGQSTDHLVAKVPADGLPALAPDSTGTGSGTGSGSTPDIPGSALCQIYEPRYSLLIEDWELIIIPDYFERVLNISGQSVSGGEYIAITKEKFGSWVYKKSGGGTGQPQIMFEVLDIVRGKGLGCNAVEVEILNVSCEADTSLIGTETVVWDGLGCHFNLPMELLIGKRGYALRMTTPPAYSMLALEQFDPSVWGDSPQPTYPCRWEVDKLCCVEENV